MKFLENFGHALRGGRLLLRTQRNARVHFVATVIVLAVGVWLKIVRWEWIALFFAIGLVWMAEALNTAIEFLADRVTREDDSLIKQAKDVAAWGVLAAAITAAVVGVAVFLPHLLLPPEAR